VIYYNLGWSLSVPGCWHSSEVFDEFDAVSVNTFKLTFLSAAAHVLYLINNSETSRVCPRWHAKWNIYDI